MASRAAAALLSIGLISACTTKVDERSAAGSADRSATADASLPDVFLPDMSAAEPSVRAQLADAYASLGRSRLDQRAPPAEVADAFGAMGKLFLAADYLQAAEPCFLHAEALTRSDPRWPYYLGQVYRTLNEPEKAAVSFRKTLDLKAEDEPALVWLGNMYLQLGRTDEAGAQFRKALSIHPQSAATLYGLGRVALSGRDYRSAVTYLEDALRQAPNAGAIHYPLAMAYQGLNETDKAKLHLQQRENGSVDPPDPLMADLREMLESAASYVSRGDRATAGGNLTAAVSAYRKAIQLSPANTLARQRLGTALFLAGNTAAALDEFEQVLRVSPHDAKAHYAIGLVLASTGRNAEAVRRFELAEQADPMYLEAHLARADVLLQMGRAKDALAEYGLIVKAGSRFSVARLGYGVAVMRLGRYPEASRWLTESVMLLPDFQELKLVLARLLAAAPDPAVRDGRRALTLIQGLAAIDTSVEGAEAAAMVFAEAGQFDVAVIRQRDAIALAKRAHRDDIADLFASNLARYEHHQPCRNPLTVPGSYATLTVPGP
jgi:tetratricopeptide (TPR) repeat protein